MATVHTYKRFENSIVQKIKNWAKSVLKRTGDFFYAIGRGLNKSYTIVLVPHTEKRVYNFRITLLSVCCFFLIVAGVLGAVLWYGISYNSAQGALTAKDARLRNSQASLDELRDEIALLLRQTRGFQAVLSNTLSSMGVRTTPLPNAANSTIGGDLASFFDIRQSTEGSIREVEDIRQLTDYLLAVQEPVKEIGNLFASQSALLTEIPNIWPVRGGIGRISMFFGQNIHPLFGQYYIHRGIDISTGRHGDPVICTADGQVVTVDYDHGGLGNYIIIKHKHGFYTRYAHLQSFRVTRGQRVQQGETIGYIGSTGLTTGAHLHYEVHIGSDVVDPYKYLNIRSSNPNTGR